MARAKFPSDHADQFMLRLPDGLRGRIKEAAELAGRAMNTEIVRTLQEKYPEPWPLDERVRYLIALTTALQKARPADGGIDDLTDEILNTVEAIASGRVTGEIDDKMRASVKWSLDGLHAARQARKG